MFTCLHTILALVADSLQLTASYLRANTTIRAENLILRRQLAKYIEHGVKPNRVDPATRASIALFSTLCDWRNALVLVRPAIVIRWHRQGWKLLWRLKGRAGRPPLPKTVRELIRRMAIDNPLWGEERIANELQLKPGIRVSPRTVRKYISRIPPQTRQPRGDQRWSTFLRNHATGTQACDFMVTVTASFKLLYVFVVIKHASRNLVNFNVTGQPTASWTLQQLRQAMCDERPYRYLIHDRDSIFAKDLGAQGVTVIRTPVASPKASALCEWLIGTIRRECLDWLILLTQNHLRRLLTEWQAHYNQGCPHSSLGPGVQGPPRLPPPVFSHSVLHRWPIGMCVRATSVLGGLHHEYTLAAA